MKTVVLSLKTLDELCEYVHDTLCRHEALDPNQSPLQKSLVQRKGTPCGMFFQVTGHAW